MAQNYNPFVEQVPENSKQSETSKTVKNDSQAVTKRVWVVLYELKSRLQRDLMTLMLSTDIKCISAFPDGENLFKWVGTVMGPPDTVYENLKFKLSLQFPNTYPYSPPIVKFITPCFHPNVDTVGNICLDILREKWSALYDVRTILLSIQALLGEPNTNSPLNTTAAETWKKKDEYKKLVLETYKEV